MAGDRRGGARQNNSRKGKPNTKAFAYREMIQKFATRLGYDPIQAMIAMALDETISSDLKFRCHATLAEYFVSKLKPIDPDTSSAEDRVVLRVRLSGDTDD